VLLSEQRFSLFAHGVALFNALALGKVMLVAREFHFADTFKEKPLIYPTLFKSAAFAIVLAASNFSRKLASGGITANHSTKASKCETQSTSRTFLAAFANRDFALRRTVHVNQVRTAAACHF
jgi:hypothetical protein